MDTLEEGIIFGGSASGPFVRMVFEDLLAVSFLDLLVGSLVAVLGETEDGIVILVLFRIN